MLSGGSAVVMAAAAVMIVVCEESPTGSLGGEGVVPISGRGANGRPCPPVRVLEMAARSGFLPAPQIPRKSSSVASQTMTPARPIRREYCA